MFFLRILLNLLALVNINAENFCINCKHFKGYPLNNEFGKCSVFPREMSNKIDYLVSGKPKLEYSYCSTVRGDEDKCGPTGKYFEKKTNFFRKITCLKE
jgi:hypothetical protein